MIKVKIVKDSERNIKGLYMNGHSGYAEEGSDVICAGASVLLYTAANSLEAVCGYLDTAVINEDIGDGRVSAQIIVPADDNKERAQTAQTIMRTVEIGLITMASSVNDDNNVYIKVTEEN